MNYMRQLKLMSAVLPLLLVVLTGCEREENNGMVEEIIFTNIPSKGIRIDEGDTFDLEFSIRPSSLQETAVIEWTSEDKEVATVRKGRITGVSAGKTVIRAVCEGGAEAVADVEVRPVEVTAFQIPSSLKVPRGESVIVSVTGIVPEGASVSSIDWSIADESIASLEISGGSLYVAGLKNGTTTLTGQGSGVSKSCKITVEYIPVKSVTVTVAKSSVEVGEESSVSVSISPSEASNMSLSWEVSPSGVIDFDPETMKISGIAPGNATIKATAIRDDVSGYCSVTVIAPVMSIESANGPADCFLCPDNSFSHLKKTVQLSATVRGNAVDGVTWSSSDEKVATVDKNGLVTAKGHGVCFIYAATEVQKASAYIWSASKSGYDLKLTGSDPNSIIPDHDYYEWQESEDIVPDYGHDVGFFDTKMFVTAEGKTHNLYQILYPYGWNGNDYDIITASVSGDGVSITEDNQATISFRSADNGPASGSICFTYNPTGYTRTVNFNVGYKSISFFKNDSAKNHYKTVGAGGSISLSKREQTYWYISLNATDSYQASDFGKPYKSASSDSKKMMTCDSNSSLYVDSSGCLRISSIANGTYTLKAARDNSFTIRLTITN